MRTIISTFVSFLLFVFTSAYAQSPTISSFAPSTGSIGSLVTITGTNLSNPTALTINGVTAIVVSNTGSSLVAFVMPGSSTGAISITTAGGTVNGGSNFAVTANQLPTTQDGSKLVGTGNSGAARQGYAVAVSADGNTAIVGGDMDNSSTGAVWVYIRSGNTWSQQGSKLVGTGSVSNSQHGYSIALSADGNTAIVGGIDYGVTGQGAAWIYVRSGNTWSQQGSKLVGNDGVNTLSPNYVGVSISADGNTAAFSSTSDNVNKGAVWVFKRSSGVWSQQNSKLVGTGNFGNARLGSSIALSADGNTIIAGGYGDSFFDGAVWVFTQSGGTWSQQGSKLLPSPSSSAGRFGASVAVSADGNTAIVGGNADNANQGAVWVFTRSGNSWSQQGSKLVGTGNTGAANQGNGVSISADGNTAIIGGPADNTNQGAIWVFTRSGNSWSQQGSKIIGTGNTGAANQGIAVALSASCNRAFVGGTEDNSTQGAAWAYSLLQSSNANLSALTTTAGTITPSFAANTTSYTANVTNAINSITVTPTVAVATATIQVRVNGGSYATVTSGNPSASLSLNTGSNTVDVKVTAEDGSTIKTYTITVTKAVGIPAPGNALNFDGTNDYVAIPHNSVFNTTQITIETWVYWNPATSNDIQFICSKGVEALEIHTAGIGANGLRFIPRTGVYLDVLNVLKTNAWTHIAFAYNPSSSYAKIYINGVETAYTLTSGSISSALIDNANAINLGRRTTNQYLLKGSLDEFRMWNVIRTQAQIQASMFNTVNAATSGLITSYSFDQGSAGGNNTGVLTLVDSTSNTNNGTLTNFALTGSTSNWVESYAMVIPTATAATSITSNSFTANWTAPVTGTVDNGYRLDVSITPNFTSFVSGYNNLTVAGTSQSVTGLGGGYYYYRVRADKTSVTGQGGNSASINAIIAQTPPGNALHFDGVDDNVSTNTTLGNLSTSNFTIETWVKTTATSGVIVAKRNSASYGNFYSLNVSGTGKALFEFNQSNVSDYTIITSTTNINDGKWHHVAIVRNATQLFIYVDGTSDATAVTINGSPNINNAATFRLGSYDLGLNWFAGTIDETRVYNTNLSVANIQADMVSTTSSVPASLQAYFNFDVGNAAANNSGVTSLPDLSSNAYTGTLVGFALTGSTSNWVESYAMIVPTATAASSISTTGFTANWTAPVIGTVDNYLLDVSTNTTFTAPVTGSPFTIASLGTNRAITGLSASTNYYYRIRADKTSVTGQGAASSTVTVTTDDIVLTPPGNALHFDGINDYVDVNNTLGNFGTGNFTLEAWVRTTGTSSQTIVAKRNATRDGNYFRMTVTATGKASIEIDESNTSNYTYVTGGTTINDGKWHHVAGVRNGTQLLIYVDGLSDATAATINANPNINNSFSFTFGRYLDGAIPREFFSGSMDEVRIWNTARTANEIATNRLGIITPPATGLVAYYNFDNGTAGATNTGVTNLRDKTNTGNNGTLTNFALTGSTSNWIESYALVIPTATTATAVSTTLFTANWTAPAIGTVNNYLLDVSTNPNFGTAIAGSPFTIASPTLTYNVTGLTAGNTYYYRVRADKTTITGQGGPSNIITVTTAGGIVWNGSTSNAWGTAANWSTGTVPTSVDAVIIPTGAANMPVNLTGSRAAGSLSIQPGASLTMNGELLIYISLSNAGIIIPTPNIGLLWSFGSSSVVTFSGDISIGRFFPVASLGTIIAPGSTVSVTEQVNVSSPLTTNGGLILKSTATQTANLAQTSTITGNVVVERYIPPKTARKWSFLASPISTSVRNAWQQQIFVTGIGTGGASTCGGTTTGNGGGTDKYNGNGFDISLANATTIYGYNGALSGIARWVSISNTTTTLVPGKGYRVNIRGPRGSGDNNCVDALNTASPTAPAATTLSATGAITTGVNTGNISVALDAGAGTHSLLGNPYACTLDFNNFYTDNTNLGTNGYWSYSPQNIPGTGSANTYSAYNTGIATNAGGFTTMRYIASGQSFFVDNGTGGTVTFRDAHKTTSNLQNGQFRTYSNTDIIRTALQDATGTNVLDEVVVRFINEIGVDKLNKGVLDSRSINEGAPILVSFKQAEQLAIQTRPLTFVNDTVKLGVSIAALGNYQLKMSEYEQFATASFIKLRDKFLNVEQDVRANAVYTFSVTADPNSKGNERFEIVFKGTAALPVSYIGITAKNQGANEVAVNWQLPSETDINQYEVERSVDGSSFTTRGIVQSRGNSNNQQSYSYTDAPRLAGTSYYRIKAIDKQGQTNYSPVVKVSNGKEQLNASIYPNPVKDKLNMVLQNAGGTYKLRIATVDGKTLQTQIGNTAVTGNIISINISNLIPGVYMVEVTDSKGNRLTEKMLKQ